jgi:RsiW-degrading membrane proteinase PrsW (M82 family)
MATQRQVPSNEAQFKLSRSAVFPLVGGRSTWSREHLLPIFVTIVAGIALFGVPYSWLNLSANGKPLPVEINKAAQTFSILGVFIAFIVCYYINQMCGTAKRGWVLAAVAFFTFLLLGTPLWSSPIWHAWYNFFYSVIPGTALQKSSSPAANLAGYFFGTGLCEESFKAIPLFLLALLGTGLAFLSRHTMGRSSAILASIRRRVCLCDPLDGVVMGVASGAGFFCNETLLQYVPNVMNGAKYPGTQAFDGMVLLLARGLPEMTEHSAWAGLFGYFIGLAVLQPRMAAILIPIGWFSAAALHGAWDGIGSVTSSDTIAVLFLIGDGLLSYALLAGAIFKGREISPGRGLGPPANQSPPTAAAPALATAQPAASGEAEWD